MIKNSISAGKNGTLTVKSSVDFRRTQERLEAAIKDKGAHVFCWIDHSGEAAKVGLVMLPTLLVVFGNAKAGTPLMVQSQELALDLPLKALIWEDDAGAVFLSCNRGEFLRERYALAGDIAALRVVEKLITEAAGGCELDKNEGSN